MCGLFGFVSKNGDGPDLDRLRCIAAETEQRGRHAFGLAWLDRDGRMHTFKRPGPATDRLEDLDECADALVVVGHCRWATHGTPRDNRNNHPHPAGRGWLVHNGVVFNHARLAHEYGLVPRTACDSEVLGLLMARIPGALELRAARVAQAVDGPLALLGVWTKPARLLIVRRGNPLWLGETTGGGYFGSLSGELPGQPKPIPDGSSVLLTVGGGTIQQRAAVIGR